MKTPLIATIALCALVSTVSGAFITPVCEARGVVSGGYYEIGTIVVPQYPDGSAPTIAVPAGTHTIRLYGGMNGAVEEQTVRVPMNGNTVVIFHGQAAITPTNHVISTDNVVEPTPEPTKVQENNKDGEKNEKPGKVKNK